jgi:diacylglycerol kinase (ATP)
MIKCIKKLVSNLLYSLNGLKIALKEHSFVLEIIGGIVLIPFLIITEIEIIHKVLIIIVYLILLAFELINTAIEKISNKITKKFDLEIKEIKDLSSSAVFIMLVLLLILLVMPFF